MTRCTEKIWEEFNIPLKEFLKRRVKREQDIEDILQNVFYKIHNNINNLNEKDKIHAWIYRITKNAIADFYRNKKSETHFTELTEDFISEKQDEENENDNEKIALCLKEMIKYLPEKYKQAIILTEFQNLTQKQLAERMGLSLSGAKSRVQRARVKLKDMLLGCCYLEFDCRGNIIDYEHKCSDCKFC